MPTSDLQARGAAGCAPSPRSARGPSAVRGRWALAALGLFVLAMVVMGRALDVEHHVETAQSWVGALGVLAPAAYVSVYTAATLIGVPGLPFTLLAPILFGPLPGFVVMVIASALSAALGFLIARFLARDLVARRLDGASGFARLAALVEEHHWMVIPLVRIVPLAPFVVVNYGFGLTGIAFWRYFLWTELAMIPMNAVLVFGADVLYRATTGGATAWPLLVAVLADAGALGALALFGRKAARRP